MAPPSERSIREALEKRKDHLLANIEWASGGGRVVVQSRPAFLRLA
jgi:hypothetical protein